MRRQYSGLFNTARRIILCAVVMWVCPYKASGIDRDIISVKILTISPDTCIGHSTLNLEAVLTNDTSQVIEISPAGVGGGIKIYKYEKSKAAFLFTSIDDFDDDYIKNGKWVRIPPHKSVVIPFSQPLSDEYPSLGAALNNPGPYAILIEFKVYKRLKDGRIVFRGTVESNMAMFMIGDCSN